MAQRLQDWAVGKYIYDDGTDGCLEWFSDIRESINKQKINAVYRAGKVLLFELDRGTILCHNAMSGFWDTDDEPWTFDYVEGKRTATEKDVRTHIPLMDASRKHVHVLRFHDSRMFGNLKYYECRAREVPHLDKLGPEALITKCMLPNRPVWNVLDTVLLAKKSPIKNLLLQQELVAGVGNIYATEALFMAGIHPERPGTSLKSGELAKLFDCTVTILTCALNNKLQYGNYLQIYRKKVCPTCGKNVQRKAISGRSSYFCVLCQH